MNDIGKTYDKLGTAYSRWTKFQDGLVVNKMRSKVLGGRSGRILEIGVADGKNLRYYAKSSQVTGVDLSPVMLKLARQKAVECGVSFVTVTGDASRLSLPNGHYDHVVCVLGGCCFEYPLGVFREMRRVLRPGGRALFIEHVRPASSLGQLAMQAIKPLTQCVLGCDPTRDTMSSIERAGFHVRHVDRALGGVLLGIEAGR